MYRVPEFLSNRPPPLPRKRVCSPPDPIGGDTLACGAEVGGTQFTRLDKWTYTLVLYSMKYIIIPLGYRQTTYTLVAISGPKKPRFQGPPLQTPLVRSLPFQGPIKSRFHPPLQTPLVMDYSPIQIHTFRPIYTTGTLKVKNCTFEKKFFKGCLERILSHDNFYFSRRHRLAIRNCYLQIYNCGICRSILQNLLF